MTELQEVSLFSGIGGISLGLERAGVRATLLCEYDKHARSILQRHYPEAAIHNDVTELTADDCRAAGAVPERTILTAGFPCQDLSVAGRRRGMGEGTRSGLYWHVDRLLAEFRPAWVILENVPGLLSAACPCPGDGTCAGTCPGELHAVPGGVCDGGCVNVHGGTMGAVLGSLADRGYGFSYRVLDARHFGVPQRRRRVVIVGRLGDTGAAAAQVLLEPEGVPGNPAAGIAPRPGAARAARAGAAAGRWVADLAPTLSAPSGGSRRYGTDADTAGSLVVGVLGDHTHALTAEGHDASEDGTGRGAPVIAFALRGREEGALPEVHGDGQTIGSLRAAAGGSSRDYLAYAPEFVPALTTRAGNTQDDQQTGQLITYAADEVSTLQAAGGERGYRIDAEAAAGGHQVAASSSEDSVIVRRLTPLECERLQGYPDGWTDNGQADTHRSKQLGNSVAVPVFEWVGRRLVAVDNQLCEVA